MCSLLSQQRCWDKKHALFILLDEWRPVTLCSDWYSLNNGMQILLGKASKTCLKAKYLLILHQCKTILLNVWWICVGYLQRKRAHKPQRVLDATHDAFSNAAVLELCWQGHYWGHHWKGKTIVFTLACFGGQGRCAAGLTKDWGLGREE